MEEAIKKFAEAFDFTDEGALAFLANRSDFQAVCDFLQMENTTALYEKFGKYVKEKHGKGVWTMPRLAYYQDDRVLDKPIMAMLERGYESDAIAEILRANQDYVKRVIHRLSKTKPRRERKPRKRTRRDYTKFSREDYLALRAEGKTRDEIAALWNMGVVSLRNNWLFHWQIAKANEEEAALDEYQRSADR